MMVAVIGLSPDQARALCAAHAHLGVVEPANFNSPDQIVIGGDAPAVAAAAAAASAMGARRAVPPPAGAPFHTSLTRPPAARPAAEPERTPIRPAELPPLDHAAAQPGRPA